MRVGQLPPLWPFLTPSWRQTAPSPERTFRDGRSATDGRSARRAHMNAAEGSVQHAIVADVTSLLAHPHESVRRTAAEALLRIPANEWQTAELTALLVGQAQQVFDPGLALTAIEALAQLPPTRLKAHATAIVSLLGRDDSTLRRAAVAPLGVLAPSALANVAPALLEAIVKLGASEDDLELETACSLPRLLRRLPTAALLPRLATVVELLRHPFSEVRLTAVALVGSLAGEFDPALVARLAELLDHAGELHSEQVRCAALEALGEVGAVAPAALATVAGAVLYRLASTSVS